MHLTSSPVAVVVVVVGRDIWQRLSVHGPTRVDGARGPLGKIKSTHVNI